MNEINHQLQLENILNEIKKGSRPSLLLHCCCAPCASYVLEYLSPYFDITAFFYNPNIHPKEEYDLRLNELKRLIDKVHPNVRLVIGEYDKEEFLKAASGLEKEEEGGVRCKNCFNLRLDKTAKTAKQSGYDYFTTTLTISPHKDVKAINDIGTMLSEKFKVNFLPADFKKKGGFIRSIKLCREYGIYRQNYCGCAFSKA
ncbi:MAG: epoxyqueuosine reductase QueH [Eubacteriales bacterium]